MQKEFLLIALFTCHWLADYTWLSTSWMLKAKQFGKPVLPIYFHAKVHMILMGLALLPFTGFSKTWGCLCIFQLITHFLIDVWKGVMNKTFPIFRDNTKYPHWILFGFDQLLHAIVIILMAYYATN